MKNALFCGLFYQFMPETGDSTNGRLMITGWYANIFDRRNDKSLWKKKK